MNRIGPVFVLFIMFLFVGIVGLVVWQTNAVSLKQGEANTQVIEEENQKSKKTKSFNEMVKKSEKKKKARKISSALQKEEVNLDTNKLKKGLSLSDSELEELSKAMQRVMDKSNQALQEAE